jgi:Acetyltransferase (GNAT) domain
MKIIARQELGRAAWDAAAESSPEAWFWHRYHVCDITIRDWPGRSDAGFAVLSDRDEVSAIVPAFVIKHRTRYGLTVRYLTSTGGPALSGTMNRSRRQETLNAVADELKSRGLASAVVNTTISLSAMAPAIRGPDGPRINPLLYLGCHDVSGQTWVTDLRHGAERAWNQFEGRARTSVRKAEAGGVSVRQATSTDDWRLLYELHQVTYHRLGVPSYPAALFRTIFEHLIPAGLCYVQIAELNGTPIAANSIARWKQGGYYWQGFASDAGLRANALNLLIWYAIKNLAAEGGLEWLECGDACLNPHHSKMHQLSDFKKSFGGDLYPVFRGQFNGTDKIYNRLVHLKGVITGR